MGSLYGPSKRHATLSAAPEATSNASEHRDRYQPELPGPRNRLCTCYRKRGFREVARRAPPNVPEQHLRDGRPPSGQRPGEGESITALGVGRVVMRYEIGAATSNVTCEVEALALYAGQGVGLATRIQPAGEIVRELAGQAEQLLPRCAGLVHTE